MAAKTRFESISIQRRKKNDGEKDRKRRKKQQEKYLLCGNVLVMCASAQPHRGHSILLFNEYTKRRFITDDGRSQFQYCCCVRAVWIISFEFFWFCCFSNSVARTFESRSMWSHNSNINCNNLDSINSLQWLLTWMQRRQGELTNNKIICNDFF